MLTCISIIKMEQLTLKDQLKQPLESNKPTLYLECLKEQDRINFIYLIRQIRLQKKTVTHNKVKRKESQIMCNQCCLSLECMISLKTYAEVSHEKIVEALEKCFNIVRISIVCLLEVKNRFLTELLQATYIQQVLMNQ